MNYLDNCLLAYLYIVLYYFVEYLFILKSTMNCISHKLVYKSNFTFGKLHRLFSLKDNCVYGRFANFHVKSDTAVFLFKVKLKILDANTDVRTPLKCSRTFLAKWMSFDTHRIIDGNIIFKVTQSNQYYVCICYFLYILIIW